MLWPSIFFLLLCLIIHFLVLALARSARAFQPIYDLSPKSHAKKKFTPSFGGVGFVLALLFVPFFVEGAGAPIFWCVGLFAVFALIGFLDDGLSFFRHKNKGLSARQKFLLQNFAALVFLAIFHLAIRPIGVFEFLLFWFILVGASNGANLSDGLDGLLAGLSVITLCGFYAYFSSNSDLGMASFSLLSALMYLSFLSVNGNPAKIFMGDTGSLPTGALFAALALIAGNPWMLISLGGVYIIETLSVMIQVAVFKRTKKRIFLMSPLHHHFELMGFSERQTVLLLWSIGAVFLTIFLVFSL